MNQKPQPQEPTSQRDRRIMLRTRAQGIEARGRIGERVKEWRRSAINTTRVSCRRDVGKEGDLGVERKKRRQESGSPVAADPDTLDSDDSSKEAEGRARHSRLKEELYK